MIGSYTCTMHSLQEPAMMGWQCRIDNTAGMCQGIDLLLSLYLSFLFAPRNATRLYFVPAIVFFCFSCTARLAGFRTLQWTPHDAVEPLYASCHFVLSTLVFVPQEHRMLREELHWLRIMCTCFLLLIISPPSVHSVCPSVLAGQDG